MGHNGTIGGRVNKNWVTWCHMYCDILVWTLVSRLDPHYTIQIIQSWQAWAVCFQIVSTSVLTDLCEPRSNQPPLFRVTKGVARKKVVLCHGTPCGDLGTGLMENHIVSMWHPATSCSLLDACAFPMSSQSSFELSQLLWHNFSCVSKPNTSTRILSCFPLGFFIHLASLSTLPTRLRNVSGWRLRNAALRVACIVASAKFRPFNCRSQAVVGTEHIPSIWRLAFDGFGRQLYYYYVYTYIWSYIVHTWVPRKWEKTWHWWILTWCAAFGAPLSALRKIGTKYHSIELSTSFLLDLDFRNIFQTCSPRIELACCEQSISKQCIQYIRLHKKAFLLPSLQYAASRTRCRKWVIVSNTHHFDEVENNLCHSGSDNKTRRHEPNLGPAANIPTRPLCRIVIFTVAAHWIHFVTRLSQLALQS